MYYSFVHSYISYGAMIWTSANKHKLQKIHRMQNGAVRNVLSARFNAPSTPIYKQLGIPKFNDIAKIQMCNIMWWLHRNPEGLESDLRTKIGQNGISSGVGRQDLKFPLCYLSEGRKLLLTTRNNSGGLAIARHKFPDRMERFKTVGKLFPNGQLGAGSYVGCKSLTNWP